MKLIQGDCIEEMKRLIDKNYEVDLILTDPPYGTVNGLSIKGWEGKNNTNWDCRIDTSDLFTCADQLLRKNGVLVLFSQEPYTSYLRQYNYYNMEFTYPLYWVKNHFANNLSCKKAPVSYVEDITVFRKKHDPYNTHPLREYAQTLLKEMGVSSKDIEKKLGHRKAEHFFYKKDSTQFSLCTKETYDELIKTYHIDKLNCYKPYSDLYEINQSYSPVTFNLWDGNKTKSNVLKYSKPINRLHPTQKPVDLLEDLILTYSNERDVVLDFTMGSGSTGVACQNTNRDFIGIELDPEYYNIAVKRINDPQTKLI